MSKKDKSVFGVSYGPITCEKFARNVWVAKTMVKQPLECEVTMRGNSEANAIEKLKKFLDSK